MLILRAIFKLITHVIGDSGKWRRFMFLVVPLLTVVVALVAVAVWWLPGDDGLQVVLHGLGPATSAMLIPADSHADAAVCRRTWHPFIGDPPVRDPASFHAFFHR